MVEKLRDEIIESQKSRNDFMKWKLILAAALGATGLGLGPYASAASPVLLALIPFVCLYVDAICFHNDIRILVIARFLRTQAPDSVASRYEAFCATNRVNFVLEEWALVGTTVMLSVSVGSLGVVTWCRPAAMPSAASAVQGILMLGGLVGTVLGLAFYRYFRARRHLLDSDAPLQAAG